MIRLFPNVVKLEPDKIHFNKISNLETTHRILEKANELGVDRVILQCKGCRIGRYNLELVPMLPVGDLDAKYVFISKAPTLEEYTLGLPMEETTPNGSIFHEYLKALGISYDEVFITYTCLCPMRDKRSINFEEVLACSQHLLAQLYYILEGSKYIFLLGNDACKIFFGHDTKSTLELMKIVYKTTLFGREVFIIPVINPSYIMRKPSYKEQTLNYLKEVKNLIEPGVSSIQEINPQIMNKKFAKPSIISPPTHTTTINVNTPTVEELLEDLRKSYTNF
jgi:uracil-DNA glycosylase family 4